MGIDYGQYNITDVTNFVRQSEAKLAHKAIQVCKKLSVGEMERLEMENFILANISLNCLSMFICTGITCVGDFRGEHLGYWQDKLYVTDISTDNFPNESRPWMVDNLPHKHQDNICKMLNFLKKYFKNYL